MGQRGARRSGPALTVKSILSGADIDPHSYEVSPADAAAIADAPLVVYNGGGYDSWVDDVLARHPDARPVNAYSFWRPTDNPATSTSSTT